MSAVWSPSGLGLELCVAVEIAVFLVVQWRLYTDPKSANYETLQWTKYINTI